MEGEGSQALKFPLTPPAHVRSLAEVTAEQKYLREQVQALHSKVDHIESRMEAHHLAITELLGALAKEVRKLKPRKAKR